MTSFSWSKDHEETRSMVLIPYVWVKDSRWKAVDIFRDSNDDQGGLIEKTPKYSCKDKAFLKGQGWKGGWWGDFSFPKCLIFSSRLYLPPWEPLQSLALGIPAMTRKEQGFLIRTWHKGRTRISFGYPVPSIQLIICGPQQLFIQYRTKKAWGQRYTDLPG